MYFAKSMHQYLLFCISLFYSRFLHSSHLCLVSDLPVRNVLLQWISHSDVHVTVMSCNWHLHQSIVCIPQRHGFPHLIDWTQKRFSSCVFLEGVAWSTLSSDNLHPQEAFSVKTVAISNAKFSSSNLSNFNFLMPGLFSPFNMLLK